MRDFVVEVRRKLRPDVRNLAIRGIAAGSQPFVLWKDRQFAAHRRRYDPRALESGPSDESATQNPTDAALAPPTFLNACWSF
jgi:hypothetical protein